MEEKKFEETWDKKRIAIGIVVLTLVLVLGFAAKTYLFGASKNPLKVLLPPNSTSKGVEGISTENNTSKNEDKKVSLPSVKDLQEQSQQKLETIKQEITKLNFVDVATSSPQVQKIISDLKSLEQVPVSTAKDACQKICSSL